MELLVFVAIASLFLIATSQKREDEKEKVRVIRCYEMDKAHDWSIHPETKRLTCCKCNYEAGSNE